MTTADQDNGPKGLHPLAWALRVFLAALFVASCYVPLRHNFEFPIWFVRVALLASILFSPWFDSREAKRKQAAMRARQRRL